MRAFVLSVIALSLAPAAWADSIDAVKIRTTSRSITMITCAACGPVKEKKAEVDAIAPLKPGTDRVEIRTVDGKQKVYRTEAWTGGSPVVFVTGQIAGQVDNTAIATASDETAPATAETDKDNLIDKSATTSAVTADFGGDLRTASPGPAKAAFDPQTLELRLK